MLSFLWLCQFTWIFLAAASCVSEHPFLFDFATDIQSFKKKFYLICMHFSAGDQSYLYDIMHLILAVSSYLHFPTILDLWGKILVSGWLQGWILWEGTRGCPHIGQKQFQPALKWSHCWPKLNPSLLASVWYMFQKGQKILCSSCERGVS